MDAKMKPNIKAKPALAINFHPQVQNTEQKGSIMNKIIGLDIRAGLRKSLLDIKNNIK